MQRRTVLASGRARRLLLFSLFSMFLTGGVAWRDARAEEPKGRPSAVLEFSSSSSEPSCPDERAFRDHVVARLGFDPFVASATRTIVVRFRDERSTVHAEVQVRGAAGGKRALDARRNECAELGDTAAIAVSIILDPLGTVAQPTLPPPTPPVPVPVPAPAPVSTPPLASADTPGASAAPEPTRGLRAAIAVAPQVSLGRGPGLAVGGRVGVLGSFSSYRLGFELFVEGTPAFAEVDGARARALFAGGDLLVCRRGGPLVGCVLGSAGVAQGEVEGFGDVHRSFAAWAGVRLGVPLCAGAHVCFEPSVDLLANAVRTRFHADGRDVWTAPLATLALGFAVGVTP